ncbi:MAG: FixH family protein [Hyphomonas sp.]|uniref:FixH family protein n=1 Tax=Hyphomonas sp. TaxID=87 RepID=UPI0018575CAD|nr:FixH family protein [Hyphomonas sp.]MBA3070141.1 FixH family protein [Hyphomonas sp.]MBU3922337.1 FixH family protein [Alphaproteobacteria bacterium]MBU4060283.1 FixH family protein [Alphaproteobacteria bacterium]MBU4162951.1 FixH family protein [Alphaproteobacteria bacterium]
MPALVPAAAPAPKGSLKGWHALMWFVGFFGFMFVVNGIFLWTAITTFPGEDVDKSYLAGIDYNDELARRAVQSEHGWQAQIGISGAGAGSALRVRLLTRTDTPLAAETVSVTLRHPADRHLDRVVELTPVGGGEFTALLDGLEAGTWTARLTADIDPGKDGFEFEAQKKLDIP